MTEPRNAPAHVLRWGDLGESAAGVGDARFWRLLRRAANRLGASEPRTERFELPGERGSSCSVIARREAPGAWHVVIAETRDAAVATSVIAATLWIDRGVATLEAIAVGSSLRLAAAVVQARGRLDVPTAAVGVKVRFDPEAISWDVELTGAADPGLEERVLMKLPERYVTIPIRSAPAGG